MERNARYVHAPSRSSDGQYICNITQYWKNTYIHTYIFNTSFPEHWCDSTLMHCTEPGPPTEQIHVVRSKAGSRDKCSETQHSGVSMMVVVVALGVVVGILALLSLALTMALCYHRHQRHTTTTTSNHHLHHHNHNHNQTSVWNGRYSTTTPAHLINTVQEKITSHTGHFILKGETSLFSPVFKNGYIYFTVAAIVTNHNKFCPCIAP